MKPKEGEDRQIEGMRKMTGEQRVWLGAQLYEMVREIIAAGIRHREPHLSDAEIEERVKEVIAPWFKRKH